LTIDMQLPTVLLLSQAYPLPWKCDLVAMEMCLLAAAYQWMILLVELFWPLAVTSQYFYFIHSIGREIRLCVCKKSVYPDIKGRFSIDMFTYLHLTHNILSLYNMDVYNMLLLMNLT
jgi:hypothetical protein